MANVNTGAHDTGQSRKAAASGWIGSALEYYDFFIYATAASLVFPQIFFPAGNPTAAIIASLATYGVGYVARPIGGFVLGQYGDTHGRKKVLLVCMFLMGISTMLVGVLPTYAQVGPLAPALLVALRLVQGFAVAGEISGAASMILEHAPLGRRGFYASFTLQGVQAGQIMAAAVFLPIARYMPADAFLSWGWRVPFLLSALLVIVGLLIRVRILETPAFTKIKEEAREARQPIVEVLTTYPRQVLLAIGARFAENGAFYIYSVFVLTYATQQVKMPQQVVLNGILIGAGIELLAIPLFGALSDRLGRRPVYLFGACATALWAFPLFWLLDTGSPPLVWFAMIVAFVFSHAAMYGPQAAFLSELFGTRVRYSGASLGAQLAGVVAGAPAPFLATLLLARYGSSALAWYLIAMALVTIVAVVLASETHRDHID